MTEISTKFNLGGQQAEGKANPQGPIPTETRTDQEQYDCGDSDGACIDEPQEMTA